MPEAHTPLLERIKELQLGLHTLSFDSAAYRDMEAKINESQGKILKSHQMAFLFIFTHSPTQRYDKRVLWTASMPLRPPKREQPPRQVRARGVVVAWIVVRRAVLDLPR
jgi:hypothetical protein